jgi:hypothetical protein
MDEGLQNRINRSLRQKMRLAIYEKGASGKEFTLFGSTANVYQVHVYQNRHPPSCTCPDFLKRVSALSDTDNQNGENVCKHICFVFLKILKWAKESFIEAVRSHLWQYSENGSEEQIDSTLLAPSQAIQALQALLSEKDTIEEKEEKDLNRKRIEGDCPICFEPMIESTAHDKKKHLPLVFCRSQCGNNFHQSCIDDLIRFKKNLNAKMSCPLCRSNWAGPVASKEILPKRKRINEEGYLNFNDLTHHNKKRSY